MVWTLAAEVRGAIKKRLQSLPRNDLVALLRWVRDFHRFSLDEVGKPHEKTWFVSNIGSQVGVLCSLSSSSSSSVERERTGENEKEDSSISSTSTIDALASPLGWSIERSIFSQSASTVSSAFTVSVSGVVGGPVCLALSWQEGIVAPGLMEGMVADLQGWVDEFGRSGTFGMAVRVRP